MRVCVFFFMSLKAGDAQETGKLRVMPSREPISVVYAPLTAPLLAPLLANQRNLSFYPIKIQI